MKYFNRIWKHFDARGAWLSFLLFCGIQCLIEAGTESERLWTRLSGIICLSMVVHSLVRKEVGR